MKEEDQGKWINFFLVTSAVIGGYLIIALLVQVGEWFDLEAKVPHYSYVSQGVGVLTGLLLFIFARSNKKCSLYLNEVYAELVKVVWPDKDAVVKVTVSIIFALSVVSGIFVGFDFVFQKLLSLLY